MAESGSEIVNAPANLKSKVWKHFGFAKNSGKIDKGCHIIACLFHRYRILVKSYWIESWFTESNRIVPKYNNCPWIESPTESLIKSNRLKPKIHTPIISGEACTNSEKYAVVFSVGEPKTSFRLTHTHTHTHTHTPSREDGHWGFNGHQCAYCIHFSANLCRHHAFSVSWTTTKVAHIIFIFYRICLNAY